MSRDELTTRAGQALMQRLDAIRFRWGGPRPPRVDSHLDRRSAGSFFFAPDDVGTLLTMLRDRVPGECRAIIERANRLCEHRFDLLGYEDLHLGDEIGWHTDPVSGRTSALRPWHRVPFLDYQRVGDSKVTWELSRHQHWVVLARAHLLTGESRFADEVERQWRDWWSKNPYPMGINWASALEVAFRSLSWLWVKHLLAAAGALSKDQSDDFARGLSINGRHIETYLSTYFSPNTHLLGEAVALFFIGVLEPRIDRSPHWCELGWRIILEQANRQVLADGLHFERSAYYHVYALDFLLHARVLAERNNLAVPSRLDETLMRQLDVLAALAGPGGVFTFGDDDGGRVFDGARNRNVHLLDPLATGAALFERGDWKTLAGGLREETVWLLGETGVSRFDSLPPAPIEARSRAFPESGLYLMEDGHSAARRLLIGPGNLNVPRGGHAHADLLSVQVAIDGHQLLSDSGTYVYVAADGSRDHFRRTAAHNTVELSARSQAHPEGPFSWSGFPDLVTELWLAEEELDLFRGHHDGYSTDVDSRRHLRWVIDRKRGYSLVRDVIRGNGAARLDLRWNLGLDVELLAAGDGCHVARVEGVPQLIILTAAQPGWDARVETGRLSPVYGRESPRSVLHFFTEATLPTEFVTLLCPPRADTRHGILARVDGGGHAGAAPGSASCYEYRGDDETHVFCFRDEPGEWQVADWRSDADFICCKVNAQGQLSEAIVFAGTHVRHADQSVEAPDSTPDYWVWKG